MHIYIAGLGGAGLGPLALMAHQLGHQISGSDVVDSPELQAMRNWQTPVHINIGQTAQQIANLHHQKPIDWYIYSSALDWTDPPNPELSWVKQSGIKYSKRDQFLNYLLQKLKLQLLAVSGTHGKTTTTALIIWSLRQLKDTPSYALGGRLAGLPAAAINNNSDWFVYEADEFDRNFLAFKPQLSLVTGIDYDHHEVYATEADYYQAFRQFIEQSRRVIMHQTDADKLYPRNLTIPKHLSVVNDKTLEQRFSLPGVVNRLNASLAFMALKQLKQSVSEQQLITALNSFPGSWRRFEEITPNLYTDYAHTPIKIAGCLQRAAELNKPVVVIYQPHSNLRQHHSLSAYQQLFTEVKQLYWLPTYLAREDQSLTLLSPQTLINNLINPEIAQVADMNDDLKTKINQHLKKGQVVVAMSAGNLDQWLRQNFKEAQSLKL